MGNTEGFGKGGGGTLEERWIGGEDRGVDPFRVGKSRKSGFLPSVSPWLGKTKSLAASGPFSLSKVMVCRAST